MRGSARNKHFSPFIRAQEEVKLGAHLTGKRRPGVRVGAVGIDQVTVCLPRHLGIFTVGEEPSLKDQASLINDLSYLYRDRRKSFS